MYWVDWIDIASLMFIGGFIGYLICSQQNFIKIHAKFFTNLIEAIPWWNILPHHFVVIRHQNKVEIKLPGEFKVFPFFWRWTKPDNWKVGTLPNIIWRAWKKGWKKDKDIREWIKLRISTLSLR